MGQTCGGGGHIRSCLRKGIIVAAIVIVGLVLLFVLRPGVPVDGPETVTFWVSFWASVYSGIVITLFAVTIGGSVFWIMQVMSEERSHLRELEKEFYVFLGEAGAILDRDPTVVDFTSACDSAPPAAGPLNELLDKQPLHLWVDRLPRSEQLDSLLQFRSAYQTFQASANEFDTRVRQLVRRRNAEQEIYSSNDQGSRAYIIGKALGFEDDELMPWIEFGNAERNREHFAAMESDEHAAAAAKSYRASHSELVAVLDNLRAAVSVQLPKRSGGRRDGIRGSAGIS